MKQAKTLIAISLLVTGFCILLCSIPYQIFWHPEWTQSQTLLELWPFYLLATVLIIVSRLILYRKQNIDRQTLEKSNAANPSNRDQSVN